MPEHRLNHSDKEPTQTYTLRWDERLFTLHDPQQAQLLNQSPDRAVYQIDLEEFFSKRVGVVLDDGQKLTFVENPAAWQDLHALVEQQLRADENFRYHVHAAYRRSGWLGLALVVASLALAAGLILYLFLADEPKRGFWRFVHRWGVKLGFVLLIGLLWAGLSLWLSAWRARRLIRHATREETWYQPG